MQNRYTGDIGDFAKYGLLRALGEGCQLGIAWYLFPDESHNADGRHTAYLDDPHKWRNLDPALFDSLQSKVQSNRREVRQIEASGLLGAAVFSSVPLAFEGVSSTRSEQRANWFRGVLSDMDKCSIVFADPDNGLCEDRKYAMSTQPFWKRMPLSEAHVLAAGRTGVVYHHNTRRPGGHAEEIKHWLSLLGTDAVALYWRPVTNRTFFIIHPTDEIKRRVREFARKWTPHFELHTSQGAQALQDSNTEKPGFRCSKRKEVGKTCPECGHLFNGKGWGGIDAHWKAHHDHIMSYEDAWPIIQGGGKPSEVSDELV